MKKNIIFILLLFISCVGCMKDNGTYAYQEINELTIDTLKNQTIEVFKTLKMEAKVVGTQSSDNLSYCWYHYADSRLSIDTLSLEKSMEYKVTMSVGTYEIYLRVTDPKTGISAKSSFGLSVVGKFDNGLMVLGEKDGVANMIFINSADVLTEIYGPEDGMKLGRNPVFIANASTLISYLKDMWVFCADERGGTTLKASDLSIGKESKEHFFIKPEAFKPEAYYKSTNPGTGRTYADFIISNKKLHLRMLGASENFGRSVGFNPAIGGDYELSKWAIVTGRDQLFYDNKNKRFLAIKGTQMSMNMSFTSLTSATVGFDPSDVGLELVYMSEGSPNGSTKRGFGIFKDSDNKLYRLIFNLNRYLNSGATPMTLFAKDMVSEQAVGIDKATSYAMSIAKSYLFYSVGSKVYQYEMESNQCSEIYDVNNVPGLDGSTIDCLYIQKMINFDGYGSASASQNKILYVASSQKGSEGRNGSIHVLQLADNGTVESTIKLYKNVCWNTVSINGK